MALDGAMEPDPEPHPLTAGPVARRSPPDLDALQARLGHRFADPELLTRALTHVSAAAAGGVQSNQRLEFLGDRVLGLAVAERLCAVFPEASEGELSQRLSELVRREACAAMAAEWDLAPHLILGGGEGRAGGRRKSAILSDAAEAVIGAVFLDGGYGPARALVERAVAGQVAPERRLLRDPKTALQEWSQGQGRPTPVYLEVERSGPDHAPRFRVAARIEGLGDSLGTGPSKRMAEQEAAQLMLVREGIWKDSDRA
jgi:ribonuclease-3